MLYILPDGTVRLTRGDTAKLTVNVSDSFSHEPYTIASTDVLTMSVKKSVHDVEPCVQKVVTGSGIFHIEPSDTEALAFGKYKYDVQMKTASGDVYTVIEPSCFELMQEVTC